jgi:hypothetical protein
METKRINQLMTLCEKYQPLPNEFEDVVFFESYLFGSLLL